MTIAEKHGFKFVPAPPDSPVVRAYVIKHLLDAGYPIDIAPAAEKWIAIVRDDNGTERVYGVFGWRVTPNAVEVTDFYIYPNRWGVLAGYAGMERIKLDADRTGTDIITATPTSNTQMVDAYKKIFGVEQPVLVVYKYTPKKSDAAPLVMPDAHVQAEVS